MRNENSPAEDHVSHLHLLVLGKAKLPELSSLAER